MALLSAGPTQAGDTAVRIGIGISAGEVIAGYTGTRHRATYTYIGDTVNLAARLEAYTKKAERSIVLDGATGTAVGGAIPLDALGSVVMRGKTTPTELFSVLGYCVCCPGDGACRTSSSASSADHA